VGDENHAVILPSDRPLRLHFDKGLQQIIVRIEWERVDAACERYFGVSGVNSPHFEPRLDLSTAGGICWKNAVRSLIEYSQLTDQFLCREEFASQIEDLMIGALLLAHPNNFSERLHDSMNQRKQVVPRYVKRAIEYLHAHAEEQVTISAVAKEVGVSAAALSTRFREAVQQTPGEYLRSIRLEKVRAALLKFDVSESSLTDIAGRFGFTHYGHFARNYYNRYGEHPRETVREARLRRIK
jgi:transcriptional regulator GlxA family with amidase domain